ncbi:OmpA family protein [Bacteroidales bacterium OttesenSCG-928-B11]|nr:OmpA family protein [Bacteroidales bacterium OttesenSCG-928-E04]MDL2312339.1 OmpA family protein [Bacteroidales bacterium OttesenSCG-928-B11]MDL2326286.1 OmpA family protein [Bacteroidales bacterium OttesenSCG-928-A14]
MKKKTALFFMVILLPFITYCQPQIDSLLIFFAIDDATIDDRNAKLLDKLAATSNVISIAIYGYADYSGNVEYNQKLSEKRCESVRNYLMGRGVKKEDIVSVKGRGVYPNSGTNGREGLEGKGIPAHRIVRVIYATRSKKVVEEKRMSEERRIAHERRMTEDKKNVKEEPLEEKLKENSTIVLKNIHFRGGTDILLNEAYPALKELLEIMQKNPALKIEIQGHICCHTGWDSNYKGKPLSVSRAKVVYDYLVENGIDPDRLKYKGFGSSRKLYPYERDEFEMSRNRRVEILVLEM